MERKKLILVDDHRIFRDGIKSLLLDYKDIEVVAEAASGEELFTLLQSKKADVVILDITLPKLSGIEILNVLKEKHPEIKTIILSMHTGEDFILNAVQNGAMGYLPKDVPANELIEAINTVFSGDEYFSGTVSKSLLRNIIRKKNIENEMVDKNNNLTGRELEILQLVVKGHTNKEIADALFISVRTVDSHKTHIMQKLKMKNTAELIVYAIKNKMVELE